GAVERVPRGATAADALQLHAERHGGSKKVLKRAVAARIDEADTSRVVDLSRPLGADCPVTPVAPESPDGPEVLRHSCAHLMAQAVKRLFPATEITIGPVIANGFYYDFKRPEGFTPEDLERIETTMRELARENQPVRREDVPRDEAVRRFR